MTEGDLPPHNGPLGKLPDRVKTSLADIQGWLKFNPSGPFNRYLRAVVFFLLVPFKAISSLLDLGHEF